MNRAPLPRRCGWATCPADEDRAVNHAQGDRFVIVKLTDFGMLCATDSATRHKWRLDTSMQVVTIKYPGEVAEWSIAPVLKPGSHASGSGVRISPSPLHFVWQIPSGNSHVHEIVEIGTAAFFHCRL